jgi:hypothetical protein
MTTMSTLATEYRDARLHIGTAPDVALRELRTLVEDAIVNQPRSQQRTVGPSEIGTDCDHCLAAKLAGWPTDRDVAWLPYVGTAMHAQLEKVLLDREMHAWLDQRPGRYLVEEKTLVGHIGGQEIWGSTDALDVAAGMTIDWKLVGASTLTHAKAGPSPVYRAQADLYAKGWNDAGIRVDHVAIVYLPRNSVRGLDDAIWWHAPHDRARAVAALDRANRLHDNLAALESALGVEARDAWISGLPRAAGCFDCRRFPDGAGLTAPGHHAPEKAFADLLG